MNPKGSIRRKVYAFPVVNWFPWSSKCPKTAVITAITWFKDR